MRRILIALAVTAGVAGTGASLGAAGAGQPDGKGRGYAGGTPFLEFNGHMVSLYKATPGAMSAEAVNMPVGPGGQAKKRLGPVVFEPIVVVGAPDDMLFLFDHLVEAPPKRANGRVGEAGFDMKIARALQIDQAFVSGWQLGKLDAASREQVHCTVSLKATTERMQGGELGQWQAPSARRKSLNAGNFRLTIPGADCKRVLAIEPISVSRTVEAMGATTGGKSRAVEAGGLEYGDLVFEIAAIDGAPLVEWFNTSVVNGKQDGAGKTARIELLALDMREVVLTVEGTGLQIRAIDFGDFGRGGEQVSRITVTCMVDKWTVKSSEKGSGGDGGKAPPTKAPPK